MPCNCNQTPVVQAQMIDEIAARPDGTYALATFPDCAGGHHGAFEGRDVFIVSRGTKAERLYTREAFTEAVDYMNTQPVRSIQKVATAALCDAAVVALFTGQLTYA